MKIHYIYKITCLCGKFKDHYYIGKRTSRKEDIQNDYYYGSGEKLRRYYKKYPPVLGETITKEVLEINPTKERNCEREKEIIGDLYKTDPLCLNLMEGGNGRKVNKETAEKKSVLVKGKKLSEETKKKMSEAKIRDNAVASLERYYETHNVWNKGLKGLSGKPVACYGLDGRFIKIYESISIAAEECGVDGSAVGLCITKPDKFHRVGDFMFTPVFENQPIIIESYTSKQSKRYNKVKKNINQYTLDGDFVKTWETSGDIAKAFGYNSCGVVYKLLDNPNRAYKNNENEIYKFIWRRAS